MGPEMPPAKRQKGPQRPGGSASDSSGSARIVSGGGSSSIGPARPAMSSDGSSSRSSSSSAGGGHGPSRPTSGGGGGGVGPSRPPAGANIGPSMPSAAPSVGPALPPGFTRKKKSAAAVGPSRPPTVGPARPPAHMLTGYSKVRPYANVLPPNRAMNGRRSTTFTLVSVTMTFFCNIYIHYMLPKVCECRIHCLAIVRFPCLTAERVEHTTCISAIAVLFIYTSLFLCYFDYSLLFHSVRRCV